VAYLNGSKVLTTGSALTFDGTNFTAPRTQITTAGSPPASGAGLEILGGATPLLFAYNRSTSAYLALNQTASAFGWSISGSDAMVLNSSGNLGIGTSSPGQKLVVSANEPKLRITSTAGSGKSWDISSGGGATVNTGQFCIYDTTTDAQRFNIASGFGNMLLDSSGSLGLGVTPSAQLASYKSFQFGIGGNLIGRSDNAGIELSSNSFRNTSGAYIYLNTDSSASYRQYSGQHQWWNAPSGTAGNAISFTQAATLTADGNYLLGTTTDISTVRMQVWSSSSNNTAYFRNSNATPYGPSVKYTAATPNNTGSEFLFCEDSTALRVALRSNGGIANYQANDANLSDQRVKTDIQDAGGYLAKICAIPVRTFKYKDQTDDLLNLGVIAQEVEAVAPELVDVSGFGETPEDGVPLKAIYQTDLQYALMKCIQEQQALIEQFKARLDAANL
jgi:hypothetical protein